jgi:hypothetical protein
MNINEQFSCRIGLKVYLFKKKNQNAPVISPWGILEEF